MGRERRTRQSNREYQERIRRENRKEQPPQEDAYIRVVPRQNTENRRSYSVQTGNTSVNMYGAGSKKSAASGRRAPASGGRPKEKRSAPERGMRTGDERQKHRAAPKRQPKSMPLQEKKQSWQRPERAAGGQTRTKRVFFDYTLVFIVLFLVMFGLLMLYTASIYESGYFFKQCMISVLGVAAMIIFSFIDYHIYARKAIIILIAAGSVICVLLVLSPLGVNLNGATRWIGINGITVQPAEIFKIAVILVNSVLIVKFSNMISKWQVLMMFAAMTVLEMLFILLVTDNLSSALIIGLITVLMVFVAHPGYKVFAVAGAGAATLAVGFVYYVLHSQSGNGHFRFGRIIAWLAPEKLADQSKVFQTNQALYAIGSGGLWGKGLGSGTQKMILPEAMNDMIFAIICEELGMIGAFLVFVMFAILLYRLMFIAKNSKDLLGGMIATGIFAHFMLQVILNIGVVTNLLPSTGVTLPFISYGGTALVLLMAETGIALNVSRQIDFEQPQLVRRRKKRS